ncbi:PhoP regulatory network protein YrbL [Limihaloglobus sulfuriphilus]|uniref:PhoP regulatory network protein YrbL n=1 Tax=Limihaloglobus sulfuriphilus TaxID=1851148 RepID=A0A1Q2MF84_9BACT|nr:YrbL family protein [Limihaloglobus sulfuriphilus]AQQ71319.1 PhoP regulatory network protein YrbL [Limihaloglobus sulfuriphilus]
MDITYKLSDEKPIASGLEKLVFQHPENKNLLIKVWHKTFFERKKKRHPIAIKFQRLPRYSSIVNEITEQLVIYEADQTPVYIQKVSGLVHTDLGPGITVKAILKKDGTLAWTLGDMIKNKKYNAMHQRAIDELLNWLKDSPIIVRDFDLQNLVWDEQNSRFVIIDGIGGRSTVSLRRFWPNYNTYSKRKRIKKIRRRIQVALRGEYEQDPLVR